MALTSSHPHPLVEPKGILRKMGKERENNNPGISHPHPVDQGDPSGELAYSLEGARSSGPAWHSQDRIDENCLQKMPLFVCLLPLLFFWIFYFKFLAKLILLRLSSSVCSGLSLEKQGCSYKRPRDT